MIIDFHTHIVPPQVKENRLKYAQRDRSFAAIYSDPKAKLATADALIASMDKNRIDKSVVLSYAWATRELSVEVNDYILESVARYPKRLIGFCFAPPTTGDGSLREIEKCLESGARGFGEIRPDFILAKHCIDVLKPIAELVMKHNAILLTHSSEPVGHQYPGKIVGAHWGGGLPFYALMPEVKAALKNVYFDTAASPLLYSPDIYRRVIELVGEDKILFGTDYPLLKAGRYFKEIDSLRLPPATSKEILGGNAARLLGIR
jgi:predicted TIM-barrel fold metal-dependent hydrolase